MTRFALLRSIDVMNDLTDGLDALAARRGRFATPPSPLAGLWIEHPSEVEQHEPALHALQRGPARLRLQVGPGRWSVCVTSAPLDRAELAAALAGAWGSASTRARFVPVFGPDERPEAVTAEWQSLAERHAGLILPPMLSDEAGRLLFSRPTTEALAAVAVRRPHPLGSWLPGLA